MKFSILAGDPKLGIPEIIKRKIDGALQRQAEFTAKQIYLWGYEKCPHRGMMRNEDNNNSHRVLKSECDQCWQELIRVE